jgi:hypothetical protein
MSDRWKRPHYPAKRIVVGLTKTEHQLIEKLHKDVCDEMGVSRKKLTLGDILRGCMRTAVIATYGEDYLYRGLVGERRFDAIVRELGLLEEEKSDG